MQFQFIVVVDFFLRDFALIVFTEINGMLLFFFTGEMLYPETHKQCWNSVEECHLVEKWHLLQFVELHTIATCQVIDVNVCSAKKYRLTSCQLRSTADPTG